MGLHRPHPGGRRAGSPAAASGGGECNGGLSSVTRGLVCRLATGRPALKGIYITVFIIASVLPPHKTWETGGIGVVGGVVARGRDVDECRAWHRFHHVSHVRRDDVHM